MSLSCQYCTAQEEPCRPRSLSLARIPTHRVSTPTLPHSYIAHILVSMISVLALGVSIDTLQRLVPLQVDRKWIALRLRCASRALVVPRPAVACAILRAVEREAAHRGDRLGLCVEPPVDEVKVVPGLVHHEAARVRLLAVPAPEVVWVCVKAGAWVNAREAYRRRGRCLGATQSGQITLENLSDERSFPQILTSSGKHTIPNFARS